MMSETFHVTIRETITYQREFTRPDLARLLADDLDNRDGIDGIEDSELIARISGNPAVEEALQRYGDVELDSWHVTAGEHPGPDEAVTAPATVSDPHDHATVPVLGRDLTDRHVLVGEAGGLCAVYESAASSTMPGLMCVETEHGPLYLDPEHDYLVLAEA